MTTTTYTPADIVGFAAERDAANISNAFSDLIGQRIQDAIQAKKVELAQSMFADPVEQEVEQPAEQEVAADATEDETQEQEEASDEQSQEESEESNENAEEHN